MIRAAFVTVLVAVSASTAQSQVPGRSAEPAPPSGRELGFFTDTTVTLRDGADGRSTIIKSLPRHTIVRVSEDPDTASGYVRVRTLDGQSGWVNSSRLQPIMSFARRGWISDSSTWRAWRQGPYCMEDTLPVGAHESCAVIESPSFRHFADGKDWILRDSLVYEVGSSGQLVVVPVGFVTDFASVPRALRVGASLRSLYSDASVLHDFLYWTQTCTKAQVDNLFFIAMQENGVSAAESRAFYLAVHFVGGSAWDGNARERADHFVRILPALYQKPPATATWAAYRVELRNKGVTSDGPYTPASPSVCALGNSTTVPTGSFNLRTGIK